MKVRRRQDTPGSETEDFITHTNSHTKVLVFYCASSQIPRGWQEEGQVTPTHTAGCVTEKER